MTPFEVASWRLGRVVAGNRVIAEVDVTRRPRYADADWEAIRDASDPDGSQAAIAVLAGRATRLDLFVRFSRFPPVQNWEIWAEASEAPSPAPRVARRRFRAGRPGCVTGEVNFEVELVAAAAGRYLVEWRWYGQYLDPKTLGPRGGPASLGTTRFELFSILDLPRHPPWTQDPAANPDGALPMLPALRLACGLAKGATTITEAASLVANGVFELGAESRGAGRLAYGPYNRFVCDAEQHMFRMSAFLRDIAREQSSRPVGVACGDIAAAVCVFGNVLGADLHREMLTISTGRMQVPVINLIGVGPSQPTDWANHVVAVSEHGIFDGCLQFDMDPGPEADWRTPAAMPFGEPILHPPEPGYRHRLLPSTPAASALEPMAPLTVDKPAAHPPEDGPVRRRFERILENLRSRTPPAADLRYELSFRGMQLPEGWLPQAARFEERQTSAAGAWALAGAERTEVVVDGELAGSTDEALTLAAWQLAFYDIDLPPATDDRFPDTIACLSRDEQHAVLVYRNGVLRLRNDGATAHRVTSLFAPALPALGA